MFRSYENCSKLFQSIARLIVHLKSQNINIESTLLNFSTIEVKLIYNYILNLFTNQLFKI